MDKVKKAAFVKTMGKGRVKFAKGGSVRKLKRRRYDDGGSVTTLGGAGDMGVKNVAANPNTGIMGSIGNALGLNNQFSAGNAMITPGTNTAQLNQAYTGAQDALALQSDLANEQLGGQRQANENQRILGNQYLDMSQGRGPNPALNQLAQSTRKNVANQTAMQAGQRGAASNVGLMARQAAQQGAATQQDAAGQAATLEAQQQIAAQQNLANLSAQQTSQAGQAITGLNSAQQNEQSLLQNSNTAANNAAVGMQSNVNNVNSQTAAANQNMAGNIFGGVMSGASSLGSLFAKGGEVGDHLMLAEMNAHSLKHAKKYSDGGDVDPDLGDFKASMNSATGPDVPSTSTLPAASTDFGKDMHGSSGGGGGAKSLLPMLAALADGGQIQANPLVGGMGGSGGAASFGTFQGGAGSASNGPNIASTGALPGGTANFSKDVKEAMKKKDGDESSHSKNQTDDEAQEGYLDADASLGANNREEEMPSSEGAVADLIMAAGGGKIAEGPHQSHVANFLYAKGGKVPAMVSPGEVYLNPDQVNKVVNEGANPMKIGQHIPGKAKKKNDSYDNDTIPATLEEGGVVIPRHITTHKMAPEKAELFVHRAMARKRARGSR